MDWLASGQKIAEGIMEDGIAQEAVSSDGNVEAAEAVENGRDGQVEAAEQDDLPAGVKARLGRQEKRHQRELRQMQAQLEALSGQLQQTAQPQTAGQMAGMQQQTEPQSFDEYLQRAVQAGWQQREMADKHAKQQQERANVQKKYQDLQKHFDTMGDKYDDFHDKVMDDGLPISQSMLETALILPKTGAGSAGETLYMLAKNPDKLRSLSQLSPIDQVSELVKLSQSLIAGKPNGNANAMKTMGSIKPMPVTNSNGVTESTPLAELKARMRSNKWR